MESRSPHLTHYNTKLCESNPQVWRQWLTEVDEQLRENPTRRVFNVSENDGYGPGHCVCQDCLAKDHPDDEKFTFRWYKKQEERPAPTALQVTFVNTLGRLLKERYPDKELFVQLLAYGYSRPAPIPNHPLLPIRSSECRHRDWSAFSYQIEPGPIVAFA